ncbi:MAG TPA: HIRAN domain-containing protein [Methylophilaceae bacterium]|jgi:hypothetical protein
MSVIEHFFEPNRLWLVWQPSDETKCRTRRVVAELVKTEVGDVQFRYLKNTEDYALAEKDGFMGFPAFKLDTQMHEQGVVETFLRRMPPRKRDDFDKYLAMHRLPANFTGSDFALLGYTGAKLPSDNYELVADRSGAKFPIEFILEVAGFRHHEMLQDELAIGDVVTFRCEKDNQHDSHAIAIYCKGKKIGYVPRSSLANFNEWIDNNTITAVVERLNGKPERPIVYLFVKVE